MSLIIKNISVVYMNGGHGIQALEQVSFEIQPGQCFALVGESGSGKTTLGKACLGLLPENADKEGEILLGGKKIDYSDEQALNRLRWEKLSMVFQDGASSLDPIYTVLDQVAEPFLQHRDSGKKEAIKLAATALEEMGLSSRHHRKYPHQLSGGQIQRCLIAMATILDPEVIILDEPTSALDVLSKGFVAEVIRNATDRGKSILLITHDLEFAVRNSDQMAVLYLGQIMETLPSAEMLSNPLHPYTMAIGRSFPSMDTARDLGGIRGDAFYRLIHQHGHKGREQYKHSHINAPESAHKDGHAPPTGCLFYDRCTQAIEKCRTGLVESEKVETHRVRCLRKGIVDILSLENVSKNYGDITALKPLDFILKAGELVSIVGETGSGKTTLAMTAAGIIKPDNGKRVFEGKDMDAWIKRDFINFSKRIGVIYQNPAESISHRFSVFDAVAEPFRIHDIASDLDKIKELVKKALSEVHLSTDDSFLGRYPHELNMGALQRVCIARALALSPSLLIADEPTSSLDPSVQAKVLKLLLHLQIEKGLTTLLVSHDIGLARKVSDRIAVMLKGRIVELGRASLILSRPVHPYTRLLIESAAGECKKSTAHLHQSENSEGCAFYPFCPERQKICQREEPVMKHSNQRDVACHFSAAISRPLRNV